MLLLRPEGPGPPPMTPDTASALPPGARRSFNLRCAARAAKISLRHPGCQAGIAAIPAKASSPKAIIKMLDCAGFTRNLLPGAAEKFPYDSNRCCFHPTTDRVCGIAWL